MKIIVDAARCAGTGMCESFAPDIFQVDDAGVLTLVQDEPDESRREAVRNAVEACPVEALRVIE